MRPNIYAIVGIFCALVALSLAGCFAGILGDGDMKGEATALVIAIIFAVLAVFFLRKRNTRAT